MQLNTVLFAGFILFIIFFFFARWIGIRTFSAIVLSLVLAWLIVMALHGPIQAYNAGPDTLQLYSFIAALIVILILIYILVKAFQDIDPRPQALIPGVTCAPVNGVILTR